MKIVMLSWEYPPRSVGGISPHVQQLSRSLVKRGHEVYVVTYLENNAKEYEDDKGVQVYRIGMENPAPPDFLTWVLQLNLNLFQKTVELISRFGPFDIVHGHDWLVAYTAKAVKHAYVIPLIATIHATEAGRNWGLHNNLQRYISDVEWWLGYESWRIICCSEYMSGEVRRIFQVPDDKLDIIPNGVNANEFLELGDSSKARMRYAAPDEKLIFFVGRLVHEKGAHSLVAAMKKVLQYYEKAKLVIAGRGPASDYLKSLTSELGIWNRVYFTGYIDDTTRNMLYKSADLAVVPSLYEPFGITALEAMAAQCPVIVADIGGLDSIVKHGVNGYKFYSGNSNSLADTILHVLYSPEDARKVRDKAYDEVLSVYNWDKISKSTEDVYRRVVTEFNESEWAGKVSWKQGSGMFHYDGYKHEGGYPGSDFPFSETTVESPGDVNQDIRYTTNH